MWLELKRLADTLIADDRLGFGDRLVTLDDGIVIGEVLYVFRVEPELRSIAKVRIVSVGSDSAVSASISPFSCTVASCSRTACSVYRSAGCDTIKVDDACGDALIASTDTAPRMPGWQCA